MAQVVPNNCVVPITKATIAMSACWLGTVGHSEAFRLDKVTCDIENTKHEEDGTNNCLDFVRH